LLETFFNNHNPTTINRQGPDEGSQYRSVIFYHGLEQKELAEEMKNDLQEDYDDEIVTTIEAATTFYPAEEKHQHYLEKNGLLACDLLNK